MNKLVITKLNNRIVCAACEELTVTRVNIAESETILGNIYVGRVENVVSNINAAFIEFAKGVKGYYSLTENTKHIFLNRKNTDKVCQGDLMLVQVSREAIKSKDPALTSSISIHGRYSVVSFHDDTSNNPSVFVSRKITDEARRDALKKLVKPLITEQCPADVVIRTNAKQADDVLLVEEVTQLLAQFTELLQTAPTRAAFTRLYGTAPAYIEDVVNARDESLVQVLTDIPKIYEELLPLIPDKIKLYEDRLLPLSKLYNLEGQLNAAVSKKVWLKSGAYLVIEPTEALTVIDVNTGKFSGNRRQQENTFLKINKEAAVEIGRQLQLRNLSGIIIVDFINLENKAMKQELLEQMQMIVKQDPVRTSLVDMTPLGLVEITRMKIKKPLHEVWTCTI